MSIKEVLFTLFHGGIYMFEIDRAKFGAFVAELRKEKGITQKELAEKLCISDKAISKWETGKSIPDISLLVPLAEILGINVTELLECRRMEMPESMDKEQTDTLVKKIIGLSAEERTKRRKKNIGIYFLCVIICITELVCIYQPFHDIQAIIGNIELMPLFMIVFFSVAFGAYFWIFIKEKLPSYYDENEISVYVDGILHMNMIGVVFNNNNWPYIVKALRGWSVFGMVVVPLVYWFMVVILRPLSSMVHLVLLLLYVIGGLMIPVYILGRKYQYTDGSSAQKSKNKKQTITWLAIILVIVATVCFGDIGSINSSTRMMYVESKGRSYWNAEYQYLNGFMQRTLWLEDEDTLHVSVETEEGDFSLQIMDDDGNVIYSEEKIGTKEFDVDVSGKISIRIEAKKHGGSFSFE